MLITHLLLASLLLQHVICPGSGRHSLWALATYISGTASVPEFSVVLMLDDIQVGYFDSEVDRVLRRRGGEELDLGQEARLVLWDMFSNMKQRLTRVKHRFNLTAAGLHVQQRLTGCEVLEDGRPALIMFRDASDGQDADSLMYNTTHFTYAGSEGGEVAWSAVKRLHFQVLYSNIYLPFCVRTLKHLLDHEKHLVARRIRPRVRFITKPSVGGGGAQVTCLATDFYPRHINLTLLRDGRRLDDSELTDGSVLPNGNGLYQVRKTLAVGDEELQRKHNYTCVAAHLSLDNRLEVSWRARGSRSHRVPIVLAPAGLLLAAGLLLWLLWWRRRRSEGVALETAALPRDAGK